MTTRYRLRFTCGIVYVPNNGVIGVTLTAATNNKRCVVKLSVAQMKLCSLTLRQTKYILRGKLGKNGFVYSNRNVVVLVICFCFCNILSLL